jgi:hypothetical protein
MFWPATPLWAYVEQTDLMSAAGMQSQQSMQYAEIGVDEVSSMYKADFKAGT